MNAQFVRSDGFFGDSTPITTIVTETDRRMLSKAKEREKEQLKQGWQYVQISKTSKILVPFKKGKPTKEGEEIIKRYQEYLGISIKNI